MGGRLSDGMAFLRDASDPTGTGPLRRRFMRESDKRWRSAMRIVAEAVGKQDILGLGGATMASVALGVAAGVHYPPLPHADKVAGFAHWLGGVLVDVVLGRDGAWMAPFVGDAVDLGSRRAADKVWLTVSPFLESSTEFPTLQPLQKYHYNFLAVSELRGVFAAAVQRGTRCRSGGAMPRQLGGPATRVRCGPRLNPAGPERVQISTASVIVLFAV
jgi:hypothetical protein